jgi:hypothetical protein
MVSSSRVVAHVSRAKRAAKQLIDDVQVLTFEYPRAVEVLAVQSARFRRLAAQKGTIADRPLSVDNDPADRLIDMIQTHRETWPTFITAMDHVVGTLLADPRFEAQTLRAADLEVLLGTALQLRRRRALER